LRLERFLRLYPFSRAPENGTVIALPIHGTPLMEIMGADYRLAEQRLNYEAASETLAPSTLKGMPSLAERGGRQNHHNYKTMSNTQQLSSVHRKQFIDLLEELRSRARELFDQRYHDFRDKLLRDYASQKGASTLKSSLIDAERQIAEIKTELNDLGFNVNYRGELELWGTHASTVARSMEEDIKKEIGSLFELHDRFDSVKLALMTVSTSEEANSLLKSLSGFLVK
jgi:hypothetical protein